MKPFAYKPHPPILARRLDEIVARNLVVRFPYALNIPSDMRGIILQGYGLRSFIIKLNNLAVEWQNLNLAARREDGEAALAAKARNEERFRHHLAVAFNFRQGARLMLREYNRYVVALGRAEFAFASRPEPA